MMRRDLPIAIKTQRYYNYPSTEFYYPHILKTQEDYAQGLINFSIYEAMLRLNNALIIPDIPTVVTGSYQLKNNQRSMLSLLLYGLTDFGGAHPMTIAKSLTFDVNTGKEYKLYELFKSNSSYQQVLEKMVQDQLKRRDFHLFEDQIPTIMPNQDYYIADQTIVIYYQLYDIAPYAAGFPHAVIPIFELEDLIPQNGLIANIGLI